MIVYSLCLALLAVAPVRALAPPPRLPASDSAAAVSVRVDSSRHEVVITAGPFRIPTMPADMRHMMSATSPVFQFSWPVDGVMRGFRADLVDGSGAFLSRAMIHHVAVVNFDRRQLVYPAVERLMAASKETGEVLLPGIVGVPLERGAHLGIYQGLHNSSGRDMSGVYVRVTLFWAPTTRWWGSPIQVLPFYADVNDVIGGLDTYDIPPGRSSRSYEFEVPTTGRLLVAGGHMHDYGAGVRLEDVETGAVLVRLEAARDPHGKVLEVQRKFLVWPWNKVTLQSHHRYRIVGVYDNPTRAVIPEGGMAQIMGIFAPEDLRAWPKLDASNPETMKDLATLPPVAVPTSGTSGSDR
jgi:hypothetical protein